MPSFPFSFPVDAVLPAVAASLAANRPVVLQAPPGTGKTTRTAPFLLDAAPPWLRGRKILMLEPRRLAARSAAAYMARRRGERVGESVGYRIRLDNKTGPRTRIEILTEGLLARRLLRDPELSDTALVIFDEFHERGLAADLGLALALDARRALRPDLRILVMSATLDPGPLLAHLGNADAHTARARAYPVETRLLRAPPSAPAPAAAAAAVLRALAEEDGSILVFLPGEGEIRDAAGRLRDAPLPPDVSVHPLYGALGRAEQDLAIAPPPPGARKVVLATSIAESSLTIEGIRVVIDSGWMRVPRFSPRNGMSRLETLRVTRDRADQRRGRAGRLCPGVCYRLWDEAADRLLAPEAQPEIMNADLAPVVLQCADWGTTRRDGLPWLTPPPDAAWGRAVGLLQALGALDTPAGGAARPRITPLGRRLALLPLHPRLAYAVERASREGCARDACEWAAAITEAPALSALRRETDLRRVMDLLRARPDLPAARRVRLLADSWCAALGIRGEARGSVSEGVILAWAFPDRIAKRRAADTGAYLLRCGRGAALERDDPLVREPWLVAAELQDGAADAKIRLAVPITPEEIAAFFGRDCETERIVRWDRKSDSVQSLRRTRLGALTLSEGNDPDPDPERQTAALCEAVRLKGLARLAWTKTARSLQARVCFLRSLRPEEPWPDLSDAALEKTLEEWFAPFCAGVTRWAQAEKIDIAALLLRRLDAAGIPRGRLDALAPSHVTVPSGSRIPIRYDGGAPRLEVRIQEVFGMTETPRVAGGRAPVVMHLLSPARRPVQVTADLESFWAEGYARARKELRGRYPKHHWPEDPRRAVPTARVRPPKS